MALSTRSASTNVSSSANMNKNGLIGTIDELLSNSSVPLEVLQAVHERVGEHIKKKCQPHQASSKTKIKPRAEVDQIFQCNTEEINELPSPECAVSADCEESLECNESKQLTRGGEETERQCNLCMKLFKSIKKRNRHIREVHKKVKAPECYICRVKFADSSELKDHHQKAHSHVKVKCSKCGLCLKNRIVLQKHMKAHETRKEYLHCPDCDKTFLSTTGYQEHRKFHVVDLKLACHHCGANCCSKRQLDSHVRFMHDGKRRGNVECCGSCQKNFSSVKALMVHVRKNHCNGKVESLAGKPRCPECKKIFRSAAHLSKHIGATHSSGQQKSTCPICGYQAKSAVSLSAHIKTVHSCDESSSLCDVCGRGFPSTKHLVSHRRVHQTGEHKCEQCDKVFAHRPALLRHSLRHKPARHTCGHCGNSFVLKTELSRHLNTVHSDGKKFECVKCYKTFNRMDSMKSHVRKIHKSKE